MLMSLQLANPFSKPLLIVVVFWSFFLFLKFDHGRHAHAA